jgi:uncharacterized delta-60 repeat protein
MKIDTRKHTRCRALIGSVAVILALLALPRHATGQPLVVSQGAFLKAAVVDTGDNFGIATAVSGDTLAVGAFLDDSNASGINGDPLDNSLTNSGAVYVFVRQGNTWLQQAYIKASNPDTDDRFGYAVALSGDTLVVGAFAEDSNATGVNGNQFDNSAVDSGAVYVFQRTGTNWAQQAYLKLSNTEGGEQFGRAVAVSGDTIVVGADQEWSSATGVNGNQSDNGAPVAGAAYVFCRTGTNWAQQAYLKASNTGPGDRFGRSVAVSGDTIAVGAIFEDSKATGVNGNQLDNSMTNSGAVYIFVRSGTNWRQQAYLKASNTDSLTAAGTVIGDEFGTSLGLAGDTLVVGARNEASNATGVNGDQTNNSASTAGAAYVFARSGTNWTQQAYLKPSNTRFNSYFGWNVAAVSQEQILIGAPFEWSNATGVDGDQFNIDSHFAGAAYLFTRDGTNWSQAAYLKASNTDASDQFGVVAGSGDLLVIGAPLEDSNATGVNGDQTNNNASGSGAAYTFSLAASGPPWIVQPPVGGTRSAGNSVTLTCTALGTPPFSYEWQKDGFALADSGSIAGARTVALTLGRVLGSDSGLYRVVISNVFGSVTSNPAMLTVLDPVIASHPSPQALRAGEVLSLRVTAVGTAPLAYRWFFNGTPLAGETAATLLIPSVQLTNAGSYDVVVSNALGSVRSWPASVLVNATPADSFDPRMSWIVPGPARTPADVKALAVQPDEGFLVGGQFNDINGVTRFDLARFQPEGALDTTFQPLTSGAANRVGVYPDGRILAYNEVSAPFFFRYLPGGAADPSFTIPLGTGPAPALAAVVQRDGSVIFTQEDGPGFGSIRRLFPDGSPDDNYNVFVSPIPQFLAIQRDGKILVAGFIDTIAGEARAGIARLNPDGSLDTAFDPHADWGGTPGWIESMAVQGDGKIIVTGGFGEIGGSLNDGIARLNPDGTSDAGFTASLPAAPGGWANSIAIQADGKIIIGGAFDALGGSTAKLGRLNPDGSLDTSFTPAPDGEVMALALDASGRLLVGGNFARVASQPRAGMARLLNTGPATESLSYEGTTITWLRGGTSPEVWATTFEIRTNNAGWAPLGDGIPIAGGWRLTGVSAPVGSQIRARGFLASGYGNASRGMVESTLTVSLQILAGSLGRQPFGFTLAGPATHSVVIEGSTDLQSWIPISTNLVPANGLLPFSDPESMANPQRFYRARRE